MSQAFDLRAKATRAYEEIIDDIFPEIIEDFTKKSQDYEETFLLLGAKGQFSDVNRKFWKLYAAVWMERILKGEQPEEICKDMVGHLLLLIYCLRNEI